MARKKKAHTVTMDMTEPGDKKKTTVTVDTSTHVGRAIADAIEGKPVSATYTVAAMERIMDKRKFVNRCQTEVDMLKAQLKEAKESLGAAMSQLLRCIDEASQPTLWDQSDKLVETDDPSPAPSPEASTPEKTGCRKCGRQYADPDTGLCSICEVAGGTSEDEDGDSGEDGE